MSQPLPPEPEKDGILKGGFGSPIRKESPTTKEVWRPINGRPGLETNGTTIRTNIPANGGKPFTTPKP